MLSKLSAHNPDSFLQQIDLVALLPDANGIDDHKLATTRVAISEVFLDFIETRNLSVERLEVLDSFLYLFNLPEFSAWHKLNWWEQRQLIQGIKDHKGYLDRTRILLHHSYLAPYLNYSDEMVAKSSDPEVKQAWMRKRLALQECFWNTIDSISHGAYYKRKYDDMFPALWLLLCNVTDRQKREYELFLGIDNGTGYLYKKKSRDSGLFRLFYKLFKYIFRSGVFYIGGLELGLLETEGELSCHGSGAVVFQGWP